MGISPHEYLVRYRLKHAQKLLLNPEEGRSLADVAAACGFADQAHLGTAATQTRILSELPAKGIDGLAISPVDPLRCPATGTNSYFIETSASRAPLLELKCIASHPYGTPDGRFGKISEKFDA
ncbi:MAG TPA: helix-turn-helix domain-containing protein [Blastocatellia bacterium]|nr:helix-turn-helix domain-containing protein [Blastocatellia bacterium]